jgi:hypothetical protein
MFWDHTWVDIWPWFSQLSTLSLSLIPYDWKFICKGLHYFSNFIFDVIIENININLFHLCHNVHFYYQIMSFYVVNTHIYSYDFRTLKSESKMQGYIRYNYCYISLLYLTHHFLCALQHLFFFVFFSPPFWCSFSHILPCIHIRCIQPIYGLPWPYSHV